MTVGQYFNRQSSLESIGAGAEAGAGAGAGARGEGRGARGFYSKGVIFVSNR